MDRRQYLKHFMILVGGNGAAQAANLLSYPFLARLYSPEAFGGFAMFVAAAAIPGIIACGRFELAIPTAPRAGRFGIFWLSILVSIAVGIASGAASSIYWAVYGPPGEVLAHSLLLGLCVTLTGASAAIMAYLMRHDHYRASSTSIVIRTGGAVLAQLALAVVAASSMSLILGFFFGLAAQTVFLALALARSETALPWRGRDVRAMFARYKRQVSVDIPSSLVSAFSLNLPTFLLAGMFGNRVVGFYSIGNRLAVTPLQLFNDALSQTFFQKAARAREAKGHFWDEMKFSLLTSGLLSLGVLVAILLFAKPFIAVYLGREWLPAADMLIILAPMLAIRSLAMSIATTVFVLRKAHWLFVHNVATVAMILLAFAIGQYQHLEAVGVLSLMAIFLGAEYSVFALVLILAARVQRDRTIPVHDEVA